MQPSITMDTYLTSRHETSQPRVDLSLPGPSLATENYSAYPYGISTFVSYKPSIYSQDSLPPLSQSQSEINKQWSNSEMKTLILCYQDYANTLKNAKNPQSKKKSGKRFMRSSSRCVLTMELRAESPWCS